MTWLELALAGLDETRRITVRAFMQELGGQPRDAWRSRLREMTGDAETIALVETLLEQGAVAPSVRPATELEPGDVVGNWRLQERLASGGMGTVFVAVRADDLYRQQVAIKLLHGRPDNATAERLAAERQVLARLQHPGIARLYDGGTTPAGDPYLVMEYVDGLPLRQYCRQHSPGLAERIALFQGICGAVDYAHRHMIVHCDLKPANVLVDKAGNPVLLDFGVARALGSQDGQAGYCTPSYASPELLAGEAVSAASDVYSLGIMLRELLAPLRVPADLDAIAHKACTPEPAARYASVGDMAADLRCYVEHRPVRARAAPAGYRLRKLLRRRWGEAAALGIIGLLSAVFVWQLAEQRDIARDAAQAADQVTDLLADAFVSADPKSSGNGVDLTARDILDSAVERLDEVDDPAALARLRDVLGNAYLHLGQPVLAEPLMSAAAEGYLDPEVAQPLHAASVLAELSVLHANSRHRQKAIEVARRAVDIDLRHHAPPLTTANVLNSLGIALAGVDNEEAERVLLQSLSLRNEHAGVLTMDTASTLHNLGMLARYRADWKTARDYYLAALAVKRTLGHNPARKLSSQSGLAQALRGDNRLEEAARLQREILDETLAVYGDGKYVGDAYNELAYTLHDLGRWHEARPLYVAAQEVHAASSGPESLDYAVSLNNQGVLDEDRGALREAEAAYRRSLEIRSAALAADSEGVLKSRLNLGRLLLREGRLQQAGPLIEDACDQWLQRHDLRHPRSIDYRLLHGEWLVASGRPAQARAELDALAADITLEKHVSRRQSLMADIARAAGDAAGAAGSRRLAVDAMARALGPDHVEVARLRVAYADDLLATGDAAAARDQLQRAETVLAPGLAPAAPLRARMRLIAGRIASVPGDGRG